MTQSELKELQPFDLVKYEPTGEQGLVKSTNENGAFVVFNIQSTANFCKAADLSKL